MEESIVYYEILDSPLGTLGLVVDDHGRALAVEYSNPGSAVDQADYPHYRGCRVLPAGGKSDQLKQELVEYFAGSRHEFEVELKLAGSPFQRAVWQALLQVPYGRTVTYSALAAEIGKPRASRAVGNAMAANPLPIVIPCHRVTAAGGKLGGYSGGVEKKRFLLSLEGAAL